MARQQSLIVLSLAAHGLLAVGLGWIEPPKTRAATAVELASVKKKKAEPKTPPPPPPKIEPPPPRRERRALARPAAPPPPEAPPPREAPPPIANLPDFGVSLSGGIDGTGIALPSGGTARAPRVERPVAKAPPVSANPKPSDECPEPLVKPKLRGTLQSPNYTDAARAQGIEGKVRVELTVDENGQVVAVRVLKGLGYGLDEAALAAARQASFEPATRCGKPARTTLTIAMRFSLS